MPALLTEGCLKNHPFLLSCNCNFLNHLEEFAKEVSFAAGELILKEGGYADRFYLISKGRVQLELNTDSTNSTVVQLLGPGDVLGWSWLYPPFEWHFSARALDDCNAIELNGASLLIRAEEDPEFGYELMKRISMQLVQRLQSTRNRLRYELHTHERSNS